MTAKLNIKHFVKEGRWVWISTSYVPLWNLNKAWRVHKCKQQKGIGQIYWLISLLFFKKPCVSIRAKIQQNSAPQQLKCVQMMSEHTMTT